MSKINISNSIRSFLGMSVEATDAEVHAKLQEQKDAAAEATPAKPAAEAPAAKQSEGESLAGEIIGYVKESQKPIMTALEGITSRLDALEKQPATGHSDGEKAPQEAAASKKRAYQLDPINSRANQAVNAKSIMPSSIRKNKK